MNSLLKEKLDHNNEIERHFHNNEQIALTGGLLSLIAILTFVALFVSWF